MPYHVLLVIRRASAEDSHNLRIRSAGRVPEADCWNDAVDVSKSDSHSKLECEIGAYEAIAVTLRCSMV